jgi:predicted nucleic acid-binding protein
MNKQKLYLETSVWNFYYADDAPEKKEATIKFFEKIQEEKYEIYISDVVLREVNDASDKKKKNLLKLIKEYNPIVLNTDKEAKNLAQQYIENEILTEKNNNDALHAALATVNEFDALISWNLKHLANFRRMALINEMNKKLDYKKKLFITTP